MDVADHEGLRRAARAAGLRRSQAISLQTVARRRRQLWLLVLVVVVGVSTAVGLLIAGSGGALSDISGLTMAGLLALVVTFALLCIERETHLRRLERLLDSERSFSAAVSGRLAEFTSLLHAAKAVNSALGLQEVLDVVLANTLGIFSGASGSILLLDAAGELVCASAIGNDRAKDARVRIGVGVVGKVALTREPMLLNGSINSGDFPGYEDADRQIDSAMSVPLLHRDRLVGVLNVSAVGGRRFDESDVHLLNLFAETAASGIAQARLHEEECNRVSEMVRLEQLKSEFVTAVSHDLRTPLTSILGCTRVARREDLPAGQRQELLTIAEAQAERLAEMIERLLTSAALGFDHSPVELGPVDVVAAVHDQVTAHREACRDIHLDVPETMVALGDEGPLRQALGHLVDNALLHGSTPVQIAVRQHQGRVLLTVADSGPGVPVADRERIFERFVRLDASRGTPGLGLGLSLAQTLVGSMGGTLTVAEGGLGGAIFQIALVAAGHGAAGVPDPRAGDAVLTLVSDGSAA
jgi:K+-sensing histidine kinase KdpD